MFTNSWNCLSNLTFPIKNISCFKVPRWRHCKIAAFKIRITFVIIKILVYLDFSRHYFLWYQQIHVNTIPSQIHVLTLGFFQSKFNLILNFSQNLGLLEIIKAPFFTRKNITRKWSWKAQKPLENVKKISNLKCLTCNF